MRKRLKKKRRSCGVCKPHKLGGCVRWSSKDLARLKEFECERRDAVIVDWLEQRTEKEAAIQ